MRAESPLSNKLADSVLLLVHGQHLGKDTFFRLKNVHLGCRQCEVAIQLPQLPGEFGQRVVHTEVRGVLHLTSKGDQGCSLEHSHLG